MRCRDVYDNMTIFISRYSPVGICSLIAGNIVKMERVENIFEELGMYMVTSALTL